MYVQRPHGRCIRVAASERWRAFFLLGVRSLCAWQVAWARADTLYVGNQADGKTPGTDVGLCGDPDAPCRTVAYAASRALSGDTVIVKSGQYPFPAGEWLPQSSLTAITDITISGDVRGGAVFLGAGPSNAVLMDWTGSASGPFTTVKVQRLVFRDVQPTNNLVHIAGQKHGPLSFVECDFINVESSSAQGGGVMRVDGGTEIALTLQDCDFQQCSSLGAVGDGGVLRWGPVAAAARLTMSGPTGKSRISDCSARRGGAIALHGVWGQLVNIQSTSFLRNAALSAGGAISTISNLASSPNNALRVFGCSFVSNTQGVVGGTSVAAASNFGGGALAISQGSVSIRGSSPGNLCQFISNSLQAGLPALASPVPGGGSAIRVTALNADGDSAPLIQFDVQQCSFVSNNGQVAGMLSAAVVFLGTGATEVSDMPVKPSLQSVLWFENTAIAGSASGLYYDVADSTRSDVRSTILLDTVFSSSPSPPVYDLQMTGGVLLAGTANSIGRVSLRDQSTLFVAPLCTLTLNPTSGSEAVSLGSSATGDAAISNLGSIRFDEATNMVGTSLAKISSLGSRMVVTRLLSVTNPVQVLLDAFSQLEFPVRSASDFGQMQMTSPFTAAGAVRILTEPTFHASGQQLTLITSSAFSRTFATTNCTIADGCSYSYAENRFVVVLGSTSSTTPASGGTDNTGIIVGCVVGGVVLIGLVILAVVLITRHRGVGGGKEEMSTKAFSVSDNPAFNQENVPHV